MAIRNGEWLPPAPGALTRDASDVVRDLNDDALREALAAADWDPEPDLPVYP